jgi:hypothetical protein
MPDGEQLNWVFGMWQVLTNHPLIEYQEGAPVTGGDTPFAQLRSPLFVVQEGASIDDLRIERFGLADVVKDSYRQFTECKQRGVLPESMRLQATFAGPGTAGGPLTLSWDEIVAVVNPGVIADLEEIVRAVPLTELAVQIDIAAEIEMEELRRAPDAFDYPVAAQLEHYWGEWDFEKLLAPNADIANHVPEGAELGFHLCGMWHIDPSGGQDLQVHVDAANMLTEMVDRRIDYIHMPVVPEHQPEDYAKLANLRLAPETKLFLGLIHRHDGVEGAKRRIEMASAVVQDFGVGHFCGLRDLNQVGSEGLDELLELHGQVAQL